VKWPFSEFGLPMDVILTVKPSLTSAFPLPKTVALPICSEIVKEISKVSA
jgi:hypothetical protein